jgi:RNA polymerase sigma-70 factor (ECF subfamily)
MEQTDEQLVTVILQGQHQDAFAELVTRYKAGICRLVARFVENFSDQDDLVQEIFYQAYTRLNQFKPGLLFKRWIHGIAVNKCYDYLRAKKRRPYQESFEQLESEGQEFSKEKANDHETEILEKLSRAMEKLSAEDRLVITLLELEDLSVEEVARLTGWGNSKVKTRAFRARNQLQTIIEQL